MNLEKLEASLIDHEGKRAQPYFDSLNKASIGIGRCLETNPLTAQEWHWLLEHKELDFKLSEAGIAYLFSHDVDAAVTQIKARCDFWDELDDIRQNTLIEMCFQLGINGLMAFRKMFAALRNKDWNTAAIEARDSAWHAQTPRRAEELIKRLETGEFHVEHP